MQETEYLIPGPSGQIQAAITQPTALDRSICGIICHPHPLFGGTMTNKVVTTVARAFQNLGVTAVRFNFRGVGKSEGYYDEARGELDDLLSVMTWVRKQFPDQAIWLAGFSFGAYIAALAASKITVSRYIAIAPPVKNFPMDTLPPINCPWILVQGDKDEIVEAEAVIAWGAARQPQPIILRFPQATHFFHGHLAELRLKLEEKLQDENFPIS